MDVINLAAESPKLLAETGKLALSPFLYYGYSPLAIITKRVNVACNLFQGYNMVTCPKGISHGSN